MDSPSNHSKPLDREWDEIEPPITAFETAWTQGERPSIAAYIPSEGSFRRLILVELVHADLEFRLKAGESIQVEAYFEEFPELVEDREVKLELIRAEWAIRNRGESSPSSIHFLERFPEFAEELAATQPTTAPLSKIPSRTQSSLSTADFIVLSLPKALGKYELRQRVGLGGFGIVFRAWDSILLREVAIKIPRPEVAASPSDVIAFLREARNAIDLRHPNIVAIHDAGPIDGTVCLVSEFIEGITLAERMRMGPLGVVESASLMATVIKALGHAHRKGIIHRDLKPSNILLDRDGKPHLTDFGLAKRATGDSTLSPAGASQVLIGTPAYMPPEQARGDSASVDARSDVYSAGVLLYELLTGSLPFRGRGRLLQIQIEGAEPTPPRELNDEIPLDLETICLRALAKYPGDRYPSAASMANDLTNFVMGRPVGPRPAAPRHSSDRRQQRKLVGWGIFGAVSLVALTGLALRSGSLERQSAQDTQLIERLVRDSIELTSLPFDPNSERGDERKKVVDTIWEQSRTWVDALANRPDLAPVRADLLIRLAQHADAVGNDPETRAAWESAITAIKPLTEKWTGYWIRRADMARGLAVLGQLESDAGQSVEARQRFDQSASVWKTLIEYHRSQFDIKPGSVPTALDLVGAILEGDQATHNAQPAESPSVVGMGEAEQIVNQLRNRRDLNAEDMLKLIRIELGLASRYQSTNKPTWAAFWARRAMRSLEDDLGGKPITPELSVERSRASLLIGLVESDATDFGFEGRAVALLRSSGDDLAKAIDLDPMNLALKRDLIAGKVALASIFGRSGSESRARQCLVQALSLNKALLRGRPWAHLDLDQSATIRSHLANLEVKRGRRWLAIASMTVAIFHESQAVHLAPGILAYRRAHRDALENLVRILVS